MKSGLRILLQASCLALASSIFNQAQAQGVGPFTYQGRLFNGTNAVTGLHDFSFAIYNAASGGAQQGPAVATNAMGVTNGLFTVRLDFGTGVFTGSQRWLQLSVKTNGAASYTTLAPRQELTATPNASYALNAAAAGTATLASTVANGSITSASLAPGAVTQLSSPGGGITNALQVGTNGWVGIGTNATQAALQLSGGASVYVPNVLFQVADGNGGYTNLLSVQDIAISTNHLLTTVSSYGRLTLMDISDPKSPTLLWQIRDGEGVYTNLNGTCHVAVNSRLLAVSATIDNTVTLISITNPASPVKLSEIRDGVGAFTLLAGPQAVALSTNNLLAVAGLYDNAVTLVNVSNPAVPTLAGYMQNGYGGFTNLFTPTICAFSGSLLAVLARDPSAVNLVDVSNPANPQIRAVLQNGVGVYSDLQTPCAVAFSTNKLMAVAAYQSSAVNLIDVSNPTSPQLRAVLKNGGAYTGLGKPFSVAFSGTILAIANSADHVVTVVDVSTPTAPVLKGQYYSGQAGIEFMLAPCGLAFDSNILGVVDYDSDSITLIESTPRPVNLVAGDMVGIGTATPEAALHVVGDVIVQDAGRMTIHAQHVEIGAASAATGGGSTAIGEGSISSGNSSLALGYYSEASGYCAAAFGRFNTASGDFSLAAGSGSKASGFCSVGLGNSEASGSYSSALGNYNLAFGDYSTALGYFTKAYGHYSTAMGYTTETHGQFATAMGYNTTASGEGSFAAGSGTTASDTNAVALGFNTVADGSYSFAAGNRAQALAPGSFVWADSQPTNFDSVVANQFLIRAAGGVGINKTNPAYALDVNGTASAASLRSSGNITAFGNLTTYGTVNASGNVSVAGSITTHGVNLAGDVVMNDYDLYFRNDFFHGLGWYGNTKLFAGLNVDGPVLYGNSGGVLGTRQSGGTSAALGWNSSGNTYLDPTGANTGTLVPGLTFGPGSGEGISSKRTAGTGQYALDFYTSNNLRMRLNNTGYVGIATNNPQYTLDVNGSIHTPNSVFVQGWYYCMFGGSYLLLNTSGGTAVWQSSDERLKEDISTLPHALDAVKQLRGVTYHWNDTGRSHLTCDIEQKWKSASGTPEDDQALWNEKRREENQKLSKTQMGFVAQEIERVFPDWVRTDEQGFKQINLDRLNPVLVNAINEQQALIDKQQKTISDLEARLQRLEKAIDKR